MIEVVAVINCDFCGNRRNYDENRLPKRWSSLSSFYGEVCHACSDCRTAAEAKAKEEGLHIFPERTKP